MYLGLCPEMGSRLKLTGEKKSNCLKWWNTSLILQLTLSGERTREREGAIEIALREPLFLSLHHFILKSVLCVTSRVYIQYILLCVCVFVCSLGVLTCAGQRPYREPLWRSLPCSKVAHFLSLSFSLSLSFYIPRSSPHSISTSLSISVQHS